MIVEFVDIQCVKGVKVQLDIWFDMFYNFQVYDRIFVFLCEVLNNICNVVVEVDLVNVFQIRVMFNVVILVWVVVLVVGLMVWYKLVIIVVLYLSLVVFSVEQVI